jgi:hypothetical protein
LELGADALHLRFGEQASLRLHHGPRAVPHGRFEQLLMANYDDPKRRRPIDYVEEPLGHKDDPFNNRRRPVDYGERGSSAIWIAGAAALASALAVGAYAISTKQTNVGETKPTVTETRSTTDSGTTIPPLSKSEPVR